MSSVTIGLLVFGAIVFILIYNSVVRSRNAADSAFGSVDVALKQRTDLIPNLVAAVKAHMRHEGGVLENVTRLRAAAMDPHASPEARLHAEGQLSGALRHLRAAVENYPDLKADQTTVRLQASLNEVEAQISAARRAFNAAILDYNNSIDMFPFSIVAMLKNFRRRPFFEIPEEERKNVDVGKLFA